MAGEGDKRPQNWNAFRASYPAWAVAPLSVEWAMEWLVYWLERWAFIELVKLVGGLSIVWAAISYVSSGEERRQAGLDAKKARHYQAWQMINSARGQTGNGGRIDALQDLLEDEVSFAGIDLSSAHLYGVQLPEADFSGANLSRAVFQQACLSFGNFGGANLSFAEFVSANLDGANMSYANLSWGDFRAATAPTTTLGSDLRFALAGDILPGISQIEDSNLFGVRVRDPKHLEDALKKGAVCIEADADWERFKIDSTKRDFQRPSYTIGQCTPKSPRETTPIAVIDASISCKRTHERKAGFPK